MSLARTKVLNVQGGNGDRVSEASPLRTGILSEGRLHKEGSVCSEGVIMIMIELMPV